MMNHLCSEGDFKKPQEQAANLPASVLEDVKGVAERALLCLPSTVTPTVSYSAIVQGPGE